MEFICYCQEMINYIIIPIYILPGCQTTASLDDLNNSLPKNNLTAPSTTERDRGEESEAQDGRLSIFIHKRDDQSSHEVIQPLLRYLHFVSNVCFQGQTMQKPTLNI